MLGKTLYIIHFCEFRFYDWVIFRDEPIQYPDENHILERNLWTKIGVGPEITAKFMKDDGDLFHCLIYRALTDADIHNISHIYTSKNSDRNILERYGTDATPDNFREINLDYTPDFDLYGDDHGGGMSVW